ncbi:unnamed protein product [Thelazia callipaeda]|uniref:SSD domain-containing protein n=1 Tax=Thelazia callipaeda TaxID=103827 RepID=A0A0N5D8T8_THECL|nr:unnamed protein product [Thelazia callipaeda]
MFCMYTFMGVAFTYIYQLTFFTAVMAYSGKRESSGLHAITLKPVLAPESADTLLKKIFFTGSKSTNLVHSNQNLQETKSPRNKQSIMQNVESRLSTEDGYDSKIKSNFNEEFFGSSHQDTVISKLFREYYAPFLLDNFTKIIGCLLYIVYMFFAILGCSMVQEGLNPKFLVLDSFYLSKFYILMDETFWQEGLQMQVVINSPPDLFDPKGRQEFREMLEDFENTQYTMQHNATMIWLDAYERKLEEELKLQKIPLPISSQEWYERCREWLVSAGGRRLWEKDLVWANRKTDPESSYLVAFRFQLGLRNYKTPTDHMRSAVLMRNIALKYRKFNYIELKPALIRNCILALLAIFTVSFIMIPSWIAALAIVYSIFSIDIESIPGLIGFMTFWGVRLESVSMITVIMSIGFAVDLSSHIAYAYVKSHGNRNQKATHALETIGWPVFMGALSTILGIMVLTTVDAYIVQIFFKTVFLVITFSMLHGLVLLPILLTFVLPQTTKTSTQSNFCKKNGRKHDNNNSNIASTSTTNGKSCTESTNKKIAIVTLRDDDYGNIAL